MGCPRVLKYCEISWLKVFSIIFIAGVCVCMSWMSIQDWGEPSVGYAFVSQPHGETSLGPCVTIYSLVPWLGCISQTSLLGVAMWWSWSKWNVRTNVCYPRPGPSKAPSSFHLQWLDINTHGSHLLKTEGVWCPKSLPRKELPMTRNTWVGLEAHEK